MFKLFTLLVTLIVTNNSYAFEEAQSYIKVRTNLINILRSGDFSGYAEFLSNQFVDDVGEVSGNEHYTEGFVQYNTYKDDEGVKANFALRYHNSGDVMFSAPEAFYAFKAFKMKFKVGRTILPWSIADMNWNFGKLNNRINFDGFNPGDEGLTGLSWTAPLPGNLKINAFASFIYIPELNPGQEINEKDGTVTCNNPWCNAPNAEAEVEGGSKTVPIFYDVNFPEVQDVIFRYSLGGNLTYAKENFFANAFYMLKPENGASINAEAKYVNEEQQVVATVDPKFYYHEVFGANTELKVNESFKIYGSYIGSRPNRSPDTDLQTYDYLALKAKKINEDYVGGGGSLKTSIGKFTGGYIARLSSFDKQNDPLIEYPRWNQAVSAGFESVSYKKFSLAADIKYDMISLDRVSVLKAAYQVSPSFVGSVGMNIIGATDEDDSYWSKFANNDLLYGSLRYIF